MFENCPNGTLSGLIKKNGKCAYHNSYNHQCWDSFLKYLLGRLSEEVTKIYAAEIINVLEHIHSNNVLHRDLKPENMLITSEYHIKVVILTTN